MQITSVSPLTYKHHEEDWDTAIEKVVTASFGESLLLGLDDGIFVEAFRAGHKTIRSSATENHDGVQTEPAYVLPMVEGDGPAESMRHQYCVTVFSLKPLPSFTSADLTRYYAQPVGGLVDSDGPGGQLHELVTNFSLAGAEKTPSAAPVDLGLKEDVGLYRETSECFFKNEGLHMPAPSEPPGISPLFSWARLRLDPDAGRLIWPELVDAQNKSLQDLPLSEPVLEMIHAAQASHAQAVRDRPQALLDFWASDALARIALQQPEDGPEPTLAPRGPSA